MNTKFKSELHRPLFINTNYNRAGTREHFVPVCEVPAAGGRKLYRKASGEPMDTFWGHEETIQDGGFVENAFYQIYVEENNWMIPLRNSYYRFACHDENAEPLIDSGIRDNNYAGLLTGLYTGADEVARRIEQELARHTAIYQAFRDSKGKTSCPDFYGAAILNDTERCKELSEIFRKEQAAAEAKRLIAEIRLERIAESERLIKENNLHLEEAVSEAVKNLLSCKPVGNSEVYEMSMDEDGYLIKKEKKLLTYLMERYGVPAPLRTKMWIDKNIVGVNKEENGSWSYRYRIYNEKGGKVKVPNTFFTRMNILYDAVVDSQAEEEQKEEADPELIAHFFGMDG